MRKHCYYHPTQQQQSRSAVPYSINQLLNSRGKKSKSINKTKKQLNEKTKL